MDKDVRLGFKNYIDTYINKYLENKELLQIKGVYDYFYVLLYNLSVRTLVKEMYILKEEGSLLGNSSEDRYDYYEKLLESEKFRKELERKYPVLLNRIRSSIENAAIFVEEIISNFRKDLEQINEKIDRDINKILAISIGAGDTHNNGKSVAVITTNTSKLVYKPHSFDGDVVLSELIKWFGIYNVEKELRMTKYYAGNNHGWQEFIEYDGNLSEEQARSYYYRCGAFLLIFYVLGSTDMHFQNVIVAKDNPYFVDLETLVSVPKSTKFSSVLETAYLPRIKKIDLSVYDFDFSGLCATGNIHSDIKSIAVVYPFTDNMRVENVSGFVAQTQNLIQINGNNVEIENFIEYILQGFEDFWRIIEQNKNEFFLFIENIFGKENIYFRQVIRATQIYSKFLIAANHPDYLENVGQRKALFHILKKNMQNDEYHQRISDEIRQLENGDVPYYKVKYDSRDLFSDGGIVCKDYYKCSIKEGIVARVEQVNEHFLEIQKDIIKKSIFTAYKEQFSSSFSANIIEKDTFCLEIASQLKSHVIQDTKDASMLVNTLYKTKYGLDAINLDMFEGGGIIWFIYCFGKVHNMSEYIEVAEGLFQCAELYQDIFNSEEHEEVSAFRGSGSILYLVSNLMMLDEKYVNYYEKYFTRVSKIIKSKKYIKDTIEACSYLNGISGILVVLCELYVLKKDNKIVELVNELVQTIVLTLKKEEVVEVGFLTGISGMVYALTVVDITFKKKEYKEICLRSLLREYIETKKNNFKDCSVKSGWAGMMFVRAYVYKYYEEQMAMTQFKNMYNRFLQDIQIVDCNNNLLNGRRGIKELLYMCEEMLIDTNMSFESIRTIEEYDNWGLCNNHRIENFMTGTSGVAYSFLKEQQEILPSIILLEVYKNNLEG